MARIARQQERELRDYLFSANHRPGPSTDLAVALRAAVARFETSFDAPVDLLLPDDLPALGADAVSALAGAVSEALANAGKHGGARGNGLSRAERARRGLLLGPRRRERLRPGHNRRRDRPGPFGAGRIAEVGGRVSLKSAPGQGTEVCLWVR